MISKYQQTKQLIDALSDDEIKALFKQYESITAILQMHFDVSAKDPRIRKLLTQRRNDLNIQANNTPVICEQNINVIRRLASESQSITELLYKLHLQPIGGNFSSLRVFLKENNITLMSGTLEPRHSHIKWNNDDVYCQDSQFKRAGLRKRVISDNILPYKCAICGNTGFWNNMPLNLQIDHINGISNDNRIENLRWLCPNCHAQTDTYGGKNIKS